uniref:Cell division cycle-associated protein 2 isoform X2 n=1 Tax=Geotrypetes seraphini TaxID=260995 RepID=A0A6P8R0S4_GEOSA|nr:cell division cycle-associated protein 2 isoform X2 [Geotrypetes seraphini]
MKENMDVITDKDNQDIDKSKSVKQSGNAETVAHEGVKSNDLTSGKLISTVDDDPSCVSSVESGKKLEYLASEGKCYYPADKFFSTPEKCNDFPCDSEQFITEASKELLKPPIDFTTVTAADFGITPEIFTIKSSGNANNSLLKARRRSTIGVRGSPETNFLIRYIAQQRSNIRKESLTQDSPYRSPIIKSPYSSSLKEKISVFRSSFQSLEENNGKISDLEFSEEEKESVVTKPESKSPLKKQNAKTLPNGEPLAKRKRVTEGNFNLTSSEDKETRTSSELPCGVQEVAVCSETAKEMFKGNCFDSSVEKTGCSRYSVSGFTSDLLAVEGRGEATLSSCGEREIVNYGTLKQSGRKLVTFADLMLPLKKEASLCLIQVEDGPFLRPVLKKTRLKDCASNLEAREHSLLAEGTGFLESEVKKAVLSEETGNTGNSNKKRVRFGRDLSPELFDRSLPPNTPLRRGGTPGSPIESRTTHPSLLEAGISLSPLAQPNFDECIELCMDSFEDGLPSGSSSSSDTFSGAVPSTSDTTLEETSLPNVRTTRSCTRKKCADFVKKADDCDTSTSKHECSKQQKFKDKPQAKSTRPVNKNTQVTKGKSARGKRGKKKMVPKPLYGERELASKKPLLSPIVELPETSGTPSSSANWRLSQGGNLGTMDTCKEPVEDDSRKKNTVKNSSGKIKIGTKGYRFEVSKDEQVIEGYEERQDPRRKTAVKGGVVIVEDTQADECNTSEFNSNRMPFHFPTINSTTSGPKCADMNTLEQAGNTGNSDNSTAVQSKTEEYSNIKLPREDIISYSDTAVIQRRHSKRGKCRRHSLRMSERRSLTVKHISLANAKEVSLHLPILVNQNTNHFLLAKTQKTEDALDISSLKEKETSSDEEATMGCTPNQILSASSTKVLCPKFEENDRCEGSNSCYNRDCILPLLTESNVKEKSKIQTKARRNTIFNFFPEVGISEGTVSPERNGHGFHSDRPVLPSIAPSKNDPETSAIDHSFSIEDVLGSVASGDRKKVRRSARLYRSSGVSGLTWVETSPQSHKDNVSSSLKARRKTMSISALKINKNSPQSWKNNMKFSMPDKENCENVPVLFSFNKSRQRRSMCALTVQDAGASKFQKSRSFSYQSTTNCKTDVDKKHLLAEREIND